MPAVSKSQQRFFGMVRAAQKGTLKNPPKKIAQTAKSISTTDAHDFAVTKHNGLPEKLAEESPMSPVSFAVKLAMMGASPLIGGRSSMAPVAPAAPKMVMRSAPSVPNPIVPPHQSADPIPGVNAKVAGCTSKMAPRYTASNKKGKKSMPLPHSRQLKTASQQFAESLAFEKQALGGIGTAIGAMGGMATSPAGHRMEGLGRGGAQGLGWDVGGGLGAGAGAGTGAILGGLSGPAIASLLAHLQGGQAPDPVASAGTGAALGAGLGGVGGYFGGGELGRRAAGSMMGQPSWEQQSDQDDMTTAQLSAP